MPPPTHQVIDARLLALVQAAVNRIDRDPRLKGRLVENVRRWSNRELREEWNGLLSLRWAELRRRLVARNDRGAQLRQNAPLAGVLAPQERLRIMRRYSHNA